MHLLKLISFLWPFRRGLSKNRLNLICLQSQGQNSFQDFTLHSLDPSGLYSDQGSKLPGTHQDASFVEDKDIAAFRPAPSTDIQDGTCCDSHLGWRYHICKNSQGGVEAHSKTLTREIQSQGLKFILSDDKGSWHYTKRYTFLESRTLKSYQTIHVLNIQDPGILPGDILSKNTGPWYHTRQCCFFRYRFLKK